MNDRPVMSVLRSSRPWPPAIGTLWCLHHPVTSQPMRWQTAPWDQFRATPFTSPALHLVSPANLLARAIRLVRSQVATVIYLIRSEQY